MLFRSRWIRRYSAVARTAGEALAVSEEGAIRFLRSLRDNGVPAWQRLQATRAIEAYQRLVLNTEQPSLHFIRLALGRLADREKAARGTAVTLDAADERELIGKIDEREPPVVQQTRRKLRLRHKDLRTERAYVGWIRRFLRSCGSTCLESVGEREIKAFLTELAVMGDVTAGTQNQAKCGLLFL